MLHFQPQFPRSLPSRKRFDVFLTHDWPFGVWNFGDVERLLQIKPHFRQDIESDQLGSPPARRIMDHLQPRFWFSGHMHIKFSAVIPHTEADDVVPGTLPTFKTAANPEEIDIDEDTTQPVGSSSCAATTSLEPRFNVTRFLALDKVIPGR